MQPTFKKIAIFGVGLIGGSFALALKAAQAVQQIVGVDRDLGNLQRAVELGVITQYETDPAKAIEGAELVLLAIPVGQMKGVMQAIAPHLGAATIVTDAGSTKQDVIRFALEYLPRHLPYVVPAHPIAGAESSGVGAANPNLFRGRNLVLTPLAETAAEAIDKVKTAWELCGMRIRQMSAATHDSVFAAVSHLPHILAFALVEELAGRKDSEQFFRYAASGFRDFTRIASSSPEMWRDICLANRDAVVSELENYQEQLQVLRRMLLDGDGQGLEELFGRAREARNEWIAQNEVAK
ncbi:MAG TPA: prephenate dehydrogenase/arogenate dehydrogenase family protein [Burkholderiales bacterium]|nr:prephenate dehydrogenase/arogenate dehydrogenase family protein [Burkholderiales bacterium]